MTLLSVEENSSSGRSTSLEEEGVRAVVMAEQTAQEMVYVMVSGELQQEVSLSLRLKKLNELEMEVLASSFRPSLTG